MFFVAGITGQVGGAAARQLLVEGHKITTLARDRQKASDWAVMGVDVRQGDLDDPVALAAALENVEGAFLLMPPVFVPKPGYPEARRTVASLHEALRRSPPQRLVLLSSFGSQQTSHLGNITSTHLLEEAFRDLSYPTAFVRPGSFIENYIYALQQAEATGSFDIFLAPADRKVPMAATEDIGAEIARLLVGTWSGKKIVEFGSRYSPDDLALALTEVLGRPVQVRTVPRDQWAKSLEYLGIPAGASGAYEEMLDGINSGWIDFGIAGTESVGGTTTPAQVFAKAKK